MSYAWPWSSNASTFFSHPVLEPCRALKSPSRKSLLQATSTNPSNSVRFKTSIIACHHGLVSPNIDKPDAMAPKSHIMLVPRSSSAQPWCDLGLELSSRSLDPVGPVSCHAFPFATTELFFSLSFFVLAALFAESTSEQMSETTRPWRPVRLSTGMPSAYYLHPMIS